MTARTSKRAHLEALGWKFAAIPRHVPAGAMWQGGRFGEASPAYDDYKHPSGWLVTPPDGHPAAPRRFDNSSPNQAVHWAYDQAMVPRSDPDLDGVAALVALMGAARSSGVVADAADEPGPSLPRRPDAELLSLCHEAMSCERAAAVVLDKPLPPSWRDRAGYRSAMDRLREANRDRDRIVLRVVEARASTPAGLVAKAEVLGMLFKNTTGLRGDTVRALVRDLVAVLGGA